MPPKLKRLFWRFLLLFGVLLFVACLWGGYEWFYVMSPLRRSKHCLWNSRHWDHVSGLEYEEAVKRGWTYDHDYGSIIAYYGDKSTAEWIMADLKPDTYLDCPSHMVDALAALTNHYSTDPNEWITWWEVNKDKNQKEWIQNGFELAGISLSDELTEEDVITLLTLLGGGGEQHQNRQHYHDNALRWLRDHSFNPHEFEYATISEAEEPEIILRGLVRYQGDLCYHHDTPNILNKPSTYEQPDLLKWSWAADTGIPLAFCFSVLLISFSRGRVKKSKALKTTEASKEGQ